MTTGRLWAGKVSVAYSLRWSFDGAKPVVSEVAPLVAAVGARLPLARELGPPVGALLSHQAPSPRRPLDPVAAAVWELALAPVGLPVVVRCLAAWWRVAADVADASHAPPALATALVRIVASRAGLARASLPVSATTEAPATDAAARLLRRQLRLDRHHLW